MSLLIPTTPTKPPTPLSRTGWAAGGAFFLGFAVFEMAKHGGTTIATGLIGAIGPDLPLAWAFRGKLDRGQIAPSAVPHYNALHFWPVPAVVIAFFTAVFVILPPETEGRAGAGFALGLAWMAHILLDRACGFGLRTAEGRQRWEIRPDSEAVAA